MKKTLLSLILVALSWACMAETGDDVKPGTPPIPSKSFYRVTSVPDAAGIIYVKKGENGNGSSWINAASELADALVAAKNLNAINAGTVKQIWVAEGTYKPLYTPQDGQNFSAAPSNNRHKAFLMVDGVSLYGGFSGTESTIAGRNIAANPTILSGDFKDDDAVSGTGANLIISNNRENAYHVLISAGAVGTALLDGFTIQGGNANGPGGMYANKQEINDNQGGGIYNISSSPSLSHLTLSGNQASSGGGMFNYSSSPVLTNVMLNRNKAGSGGGMISYSSSPVLTNVTLNGNNAVYGGGIYNYGGSKVVLVNGLLNNNSAKNGAPVVNDNGSETKLINCSIVGNTAPESLFYNRTNSSIKISNSIIFTNTVASLFDQGGVISNNLLVGSNNLIEGSNNIGNENIDATNVTAGQIFTNPINGDYTLKLGSPAIGKGNNQLYTDAGGNLNTDKDLAGMPRLFGNTIDMGAYENETISAQPFITQWDLKITGSEVTGNTTTIRFGVEVNGPVNYSWTTADNIPVSGTGIISTGSTTATITGLPDGKIITLTIEPVNLKRFFTIPPDNITYPDRDRLIDIKQWGTVNWNSMNYAFYNCINLNISAIDVPDLSGLSDMSFMFANCYKLNGPANINDWNTSAVTNMRSMFTSARLFNQNIGSWNTEKVTDMRTMFYDARVFNQNVGSWNTEKVTNMYSMFTGASVFNQNIGAWSTGNVTDMNYMFENAFVFNQNLGNWKLNSGVDLNRMFNNTGLDCVNYSATLIGWGANTLTPNGRDLVATGRTYGTNAVAARKILTDKGWLIVGDVAGSVACGVAITPSASSIIYVKQNGAGNFTGNSWVNAAPELADALVAAKNLNAITAGTVKQIWVAKGTHNPLYKAAEVNDKNTLTTDRDKAFVMVKDVKVYGGFAGTEPADFDSKNRDFTANKTILSGDIGSANDITDNVYHVVISAGDMGTALLDGFTITAGNANELTGNINIVVNGKTLSQSYGGGILNHSPSIEFSNITATANSARYGAGISNNTSSATLTNVLLNNNNAIDGGTGGGMHNANSSPTLTRVIISGNTANGGGGIYNIFSNPIINNVRIIGNTGSDGGGISNSYSNPSLTNTIISGNQANQGSGIYNIFSSPVLMNVTISGNAAPGDGGVIFLITSSPKISNSIIYNNNSGIVTVGAGSVPDIKYSLVQNGIAGSNMLSYTGSAETIFVNPMAPSLSTGGDYSLKAGSPAVNKGSNTLFPGLAISSTDLAGNPRAYNFSNGGVIDLGAYEYQGTATQTITFNTLPTTTYSSAALTLTGTASSGLAVSYTSSNTAVATVSGSTVTILSAGTTIITASQPGDANNAAALDVPQTLTVNKLTLAVTATGTNKTYDNSTSAVVTLSDNRISGDDITITYTNAAFSDKNVGLGKTVNVSGMSIRGASTGNYNLTSTTAITAANITPATLTYTATATSRAYGAANPSFTGTVTGFVAGETQASATTGTPAFATSALTTNTVGSYAITGSGLTATNGNYLFAQATGNAAALTINKAGLTIAAVEQSKTYGDADPLLTYTKNGLIGNDGITGVLGRATGDNAGSYPINIGSLSAGGNYNISFTGANLTINKATLTATAGSTAICQGSRLPAFTTTYTGFKYSDGENSISTKATVNTVASSSSLAGNYALVPDGAVSSNYSFNYVNGTLSINALPVVNITSSKGNSISKGESLTLSATGSTSYKWTSTNGNAIGQNTSTLNIRPEHSGTYTLTATNASGCSQTVSIAIEVRDDFEAIKANNILTPNGDGINDLWIVDNIDMYPNNLVSIFDRAGRILYTRKGYNNTWDGTLNGTPLAEGTYYYVIDFGTNKLKQKGFITLIRQQ